jgi:hypothetical protein
MEYKHLYLLFFCVGVMHSVEYVCDVTLSVYPHRTSLKKCLATVGIEPTTFGILAHVQAQGKNSGPASKARYFVKRPFS